MQESLYPLSAKDVDAVGKSRVSRDLPKNIKYWMYGGLSLCMLGFIYGAMQGNFGVVVGIIAAGGVCVWYSTVLGDKIKKKIIVKLRKDWQEQRNVSAGD